MNNDTTEIPDPDDEDANTAILVTLTARCDYNGHWVVGDDVVNEWGDGDAFTDAIHDYVVSFRNSLEFLREHADSLAPNLAEQLMRMSDWESGEPL